MSASLKPDSDAWNASTVAPPPWIWVFSTRTLLSLISGIVVGISPFLLSSIVISVASPAVSVAPAWTNMPPGSTSPAITNSPVMLFIVAATSGGASPMSFAASPASIVGLTRAQTKPAPGCTCDIVLAAPGASALVTCADSGPSGIAIAACTRPGSVAIAPAAILPSSMPMFISTLDSSRSTPGRRSAST